MKSVINLIKKTLESNRNERNKKENLTQVWLMKETKKKFDKVKPSGMNVVNFVDLLVETFSKFIEELEDYENDE